jgi:hypothetical protein
LVRTSKRDRVWQTSVYSYTSFPKAAALGKPPVWSELRERPTSKLFLPPALPLAWTIVIRPVSSHRTTRATAIDLDRSVLCVGHGTPKYLNSVSLCVRIKRELVLVWSASTATGTAAEAHRASLRCVFRWRISTLRLFFLVLDRERRRTWPTGHFDTVS